MSLQFLLTYLPNKYRDNNQKTVAVVDVAI